MSERPRAGWYPDPAGSQLLRYWDGVQWTESVQGYPGAVATATPPARPPTGHARHAGRTTGPLPVDGGHPALGLRPQGPAPDRPNRRKRFFVAGAVAAVVVAVVAIVVATTGGDDSGDDGSAAATTAAPTTAAATEEATTVVAEATTTTLEATTTTEVAATTAPGPKGPPFAEGTLQVGVDIPAGRYEATGGPECYWERMRGSDGSDRITNRLGGGHVIVDIAATDTIFNSAKCGTWGLVAPFLLPASEFDDGIWAVNTQITPGKYRNSGGAKCYWARLRGFGGEAADILANAQPSRAVTVEIQEGDVGFESRDCGHWTKV